MWELINAAFYLAIGFLLGWLAHYRYTILQEEQQDVETIVSLVAANDPALIYSEQAYNRGLRYPIEEMEE